MRARLALVCMLGACAERPHAADPPSDAGAKASRGVVVARVGQVELREDDLERMMARDPGASPARFEGATARRELIDGLVRFELLAQAAERAGLTRDPDAIHAQRQIAITKLVNTTLGSVASPEAISQADVEREYQARQASDYTRPAAAELAHIRVGEAALADWLAARARALEPGDAAGFAKLVVANSEDLATRSSGGSLGFVDKNAQLPAPLVAAALALRTPGEIAGPVATPSGYEILRLVSLRAAAVSPMSSVEASIRQRLYRDRRAKALDDFVAKLRTETPVELPQPQASSEKAP